MARPRITPSYRFHKRTGKAIVTFHDANQQRRSVLLPGAFNSKESRSEYQRILNILKANGDPRPGKCEHSRVALSVAELIDRYWQHVESYYRRVDGTITQEVNAMRYTLRPLNYLHGETLAVAFGPANLKEVRELMIHGYLHPDHGNQVPLCRNQINGRIKRIRRMFKWAVENELVDGEVLLRLQAVAPLKLGRSAAKESPGVKPVARAVVELTLPLLRPMIQDMVTVQLETGMRPGELGTERLPCMDAANRILSGMCKKRLLLLAGLLVMLASAGFFVALTLDHRNKSLTYAELEQVKIGMSKCEVETLLRRPGTPIGDDFVWLAEGDSISYALNVAFDADGRVKDVVCLPGMKCHFQPTGILGRIRQWLPL
jgi:hypothetical protein